MKPFSLPSFVRTLLCFGGVLWAVLLGARLAMLAILWPSLTAISGADILHAFYIGAKFDARLAVFMALPLALVLAVPSLERRLSALGRGKAILRHAVVALYGLLFLVVITIYAVDFGYYFYLKQRVDAGALDMLQDTAISLGMVWATYPVLRIALAFGVLIAGLLALMALFLRRHQPTPPLGMKQRAGWSLGLFVLLFLAAYGQISSNLFPLRWSNAYFSVDRNLAVLALNPVQNLRDTISSSAARRPNVAAAREAYPRMAKWLRVPNPDAATLDYWRMTPGRQAGGPLAPDIDPAYVTEAFAAQTKPWNVVVILMESMSWPMTSFAPGPDDPTPNMRRLSAEGLFLPRFYAPARTTARAVFTTMTSLPDVNRAGGTSSRNQAVVDQFVPINEFPASRYYLIGGSASWANIRGILSHNISDLNLLEEGYWEAPNADVWGISDLDLFRESVKVFSNAPKPFVATIQTAGFHRPWTIPDDNAGFSVRDPGKAVLDNYGFSGPEEYNSLRFSDHALGEFFRLASKEPWFNNTLFVITGDHGLGNPAPNMPIGYQLCTLQDSHIPTFFYAPGHIRPGVLDIPAGHPDIFPTLAALAGIPFRNHSLGRNLLGPRSTTPERLSILDDARVFIIDGNEESWRLVEGDYCYVRSGREALYLIDDTLPTNRIDTEPERAAAMRQQASDMFHTTKYLLFNNKKSNAPPSPIEKTSQDAEATARDGEKGSKSE